ncbi:MAG: carbohydrate-binding protein, partial [Acidobacteriota bacterium]
PAGLTAAAASSSQINVSWGASSGATGYDLEVDGTVKTGVTSPYANTGLTANSTHTYRVRAKNATGTSAWSSSVSATTKSSTVVPPVPAGLTAAAASSSQINVSWGASSGATGYDLEVDGAVKTGVTSPYAHTGLAASSTHTYRIRAKNAAGTSAWSSSVSATTNINPNPTPSTEWKPYTSYVVNQVVTYLGTSYTCRQSHFSFPSWEPPNVPALWTAGSTPPPGNVPAVPTGLSAAAASASQINVTWSTSSGATGYDLEVDGSIRASITSPYAHTGLAANSSHMYKVRAKNASGVSAWSTGVTARTNSSPTPPSPTPSGEWKPYTIYIAGQVVTYSGSSYTCRQSHFSYPGWEPPNVPALWLSGGTPPAGNVPSVPSGLTAKTASSSEIDVSWTSSSGATSYDLEVDGTVKTSISSPNNHTGLSANSTHTYRVRAKNAAGASAWSSAVTATTSGSPTPPAPAPSGDWKPYTYYSVDQVVTYSGVSYTCRWAHTSFPGWEPPNTPGLWKATN